MTKLRRPARFRAGHMKDRQVELLARVCLSRERLAGSDLVGLGQAWRLWNACIAATADHSKAADQTYVETLARAAGINRTNAGRLLRQFDGLGVFGWQAAPRGSKGISDLCLPSLPRGHLAGLHAAFERHDDARHAASGHHYQVMSSELITHDSTLDIDTGEHRSSPSLSPPLVDGSVSWEAERRASLEAGPEPEYDTEELARQIEAELDEPDVAERFPPWHGDERTGEAMRDDERSQMRWEADNPSKARMRKSCGDDGSTDNGARFTGPR